MPKNPFGKLSFVIITSFILLFSLHYSKEAALFPYSPTPSLPSSFIKDKRKSLGQCFPQQRDPCLELAISYTLGQTQRVPQAVRKAHKDLGLQHLFSPSGMHFSALLAFFFPFLFFCQPQRRTKLTQTIQLFLAILTFFLPGFYPLKRLALMRILQLITHHFSLKHQPFQIFLLAFTLDFFFGTFSSSPLSFAYSFLFLGIILSLSSEESPFSFWRFIRLPMALMGGNILVSTFTRDPLTILGPFLNFLLSLIFDFLYPCVFLGIWTHWCPLFKYPLQIFLKLLFWSQKLAIHSGFYQGQLILILLFLIFSLHPSPFTNRLKRWGLILGSIFIINPLGEGELQQYKSRTSSLLRQKIFYSMPINDSLSKNINPPQGRFSPKGYSLFFAHGTCRITLGEGIYLIKCRSASRRGRARSTKN